MNLKKSEENRPWKYSDDGSISGILGGKEKKTSKAIKLDSTGGTSEKSDRILTQTDILKDAIRIERAQKDSNRDQR